MRKLTYRSDALDAPLSSHKIFPMIPSSVAFTRFTMRVKHGKVDSRM